MEKKQTAVEYLVKEFSAILGSIKTEPMQDLLIVDVVERAKEMEKEQILDAFEDGECNIDSDGCYIDKTLTEQYYNKTYGSI
jgi:hypothetical protein